MREKCRLASTAVGNRIPVLISECTDYRAVADWVGKEEKMNGVLFAHKWFAIVSTVMVSAILKCDVCCATNP